MSSLNLLMQYRRSLCLLLSFSIGLGGIIPTVWGQNSSSGTGGSITMRVLNAVTGEHVPSHLLRPDIEYRIEMKAFDANLKAIECKPSFSINQGITGNQIDRINGGIMTMGTGFGQAEVIARCDELPNVEAKMPVANNTLMTPAEKKAAAEAAAKAKEAAAAASSGSGVGTALLVGAVVAGGAALAVGLSGLADTTSSNTCGMSCSGGNFYCQVPASCTCPSGARTTTCPSSMGGGKGCVC